MDYQVARELSGCVVVSPAFEAITEELLQKAASFLLQCEAVIDAGTNIGTFNQANAKLLELAKKKQYSCLSHLCAVKPYFILFSLTFASNPVERRKLRHD